MIWPIYDGIWLERRSDYIAGLGGIYEVLINARPRSVLFDILSFVFSRHGESLSLTAVKAQVAVFLYAVIMSLLISKSVLGKYYFGALGILLFLSGGFVSQTVFGYVDLSVDLIGVYLAIPLIASCYAWCIERNRTNEVLLAVSIFMFAIGRTFLIPSFGILIVFVIAYLLSCENRRATWESATKVLLFSLVPAVVIISFNISEFIRYLTGGYALFAPISRSTSFENFLVQVWQSRITAEATLLAGLVWAGGVIAVGTSALSRRRSEHQLDGSASRARKSQGYWRVRPLVRMSFSLLFAPVACASFLFTPYLTVSDQPRWYFMAWAAVAVIPFTFVMIESRLMRSGLAACAAVACVLAVSGRMEDLSDRIDREARSFVSTQAQARSALYAALAARGSVEGSVSGGGLSIGGFQLNSMSPFSMAVIGEHRMAAGEFDVAFELLRAEQFGLPALANWDAAILDDMTEQEIRARVDETLAGLAPRADIIIGPSSPQWPADVRPTRPFLRTLFPFIYEELARNKDLTDTGMRVSLRGIDWAVYIVRDTAEVLYEDNVATPVAVALADSATFPVRFDRAEGGYVDILLKSAPISAPSNVFSETNPPMPLVFGPMGLAQREGRYQLLGSGSGVFLPCDPLSWCRLTISTPDAGGMVRVWINGDQLAPIELAPASVNSLRVGIGWLERQWAGEIAHIGFLEAGTEPSYSDLGAPIDGADLVELERVFAGAVAQPE